MNGTDGKRPSSAQVDFRHSSTINEEDITASKETKESWEMLDEDELQYPLMQSNGAPS
jgi:hypothetical protein